MNNELVFIAVTAEDKTQSMDAIRSDMVLASQLAELNQGSTEKTYFRAQNIGGHIHQGIFVNVPRHEYSKLKKDIVKFGFNIFPMRRTKNGLRRKIWGLI